MRWAILISVGILAAGTAVTCGAVTCGGVTCGGVTCGGVTCGGVTCGSVTCGSVTCGSVTCGSVTCRQEAEDIGRRAVRVKSPVTAVAFSPDGRMLVSAGRDGIVLSSWPEGIPYERLITELQSPHDVQFSPDGQQLAIAGGTPGQFGLVHVLDWNTRQTVCIIREHDDVVYRVCWLGEHQMLGTASMDGTALIISLHQPENPQVFSRYTGHSRGVTGIRLLSAVNPVSVVSEEPPSDRNRGKLSLLSTSIDHSLQVWTADGTGVRTMNNHTDAVTCLSMRPESPDSGIPFCASTSTDRTVRFWQPTIGRLVRFARLPAAGLAADWTPDGQWLLVACQDGVVRRIDPESAEVDQQWPVEPGVWLNAIAVHPGKPQAVIGSASGRIHRISLQ